MCVCGGEGLGGGGGTVERWIFNFFDAASTSNNSCRLSITIQISTIYTYIGATEKSLHSHECPVESIATEITRYVANLSKI